MVLSGHNFDSGDGHVTGGFLPHGVPGAAGQVVHAFSGAFQMGMCTGAILRAKLRDLRPLPPGGIQPEGTVGPVAHGAIATRSVSGSRPTTTCSTGACS